METIIEPESWNDLDMDWTNPDPSKACYYIAIMKAMDERRKALASSGYTPWRNPELIYKRNRFHIPSVSQLRYWLRDLVHHTMELKGGSIVLKQDFLRDETTHGWGGPPSLAGRILAPVTTYPVPGIGTPISQAKDFLIWTKKLLDMMTMYLHPYMKINHYGWDEYAIENEETYFRDELEGITDKKERIERLADLYINHFYDHLIVKSDITNYYHIGMQAESDEYNGFAQFSVRLPKSIEIRSFAKPHVYCLFKVWDKPQQLSQYIFQDFGYGFEEEKNKVLDLGQITEENGGKIDLFQFDLKEMKQYLLVGGTRRLILQADCYFALDYNCEGGFKFRPEA